MVPVNQAAQPFLSVDTASCWGEDSRFTSRRLEPETPVGSMGLEVLGSFPTGVLVSHTLLVGMIDRYCGLGVTPTAKRCDYGDVVGHRLAQL